MRVIKILLVEDDHLDIMDLKRTLDKMSLQYTLEVAKNGEEAIGLLSHKTESAEQLPDVVLIDINMPKMNGLEFLSVVRNSESWKHLKCFIITTSEEKVDKNAAKELGVSGYIIKPLKLNNPSSIDSLNLFVDLVNMKN
ncbi:MAG TPA: response regulator [Flavisolibacter sp.]|nr:response regulator [Flavisolibacter sp.]